MEKIVSKCQNCGANLRTKELYNILKKEGNLHSLHMMICPKCEESTEVLKHKVKDKIAIFDVDNTVFDSNFVWSALKNDCKTFTEAYEKYGDFNFPIKSTINLIKQLSKSNVKIQFLTARPESDRTITNENLKKWIDVPYELKMVGFENGIAERKANFLESLKSDYDILFFMDDNEENRKQIQKLGIVAIDTIGGLQ